MFIIRYYVWLDDFEIPNILTREVDFVFPKLSLHLYTYLIQKIVNKTPSKLNAAPAVHTAGKRALFMLFIPLQYSSNDFYSKSAVLRVLVSREI